MSYIHEHAPGQFSFVSAQGKVNGFPAFQLFRNEPDRVEHNLYAAREVTPAFDKLYQMKDGVKSFNKVDAMTVEWSEGIKDRDLDAVKADVRAKAGQWLEQRLGDPFQYNGMWFTCSDARQRDISNALLYEAVPNKFESMMQGTYGVLSDMVELKAFADAKKADYQAAVTGYHTCIETSDAAATPKAAADALAAYKTAVKAKSVLSAAEYAAITSRPDYTPDPFVDLIDLGV